MRGHEAGENESARFEVVYEQDRLEYARQTYFWPRDLEVTDSWEIVPAPRPPMLIGAVRAIGQIGQTLTIEAKRDDAYPLIHEHPIVGLFYRLQVLPSFEPNTRTNFPEVGLAFGVSNAGFYVRYQDASSFLADSWEEGSPLADQLSARGIGREEVGNPAAEVCCWVAYFNEASRGEIIAAVSRLDSFYEVLEPVERRSRADTLSALRIALQLPSS